MNQSDGKRRLTEWFNQWRGPLRKFLAGRRGVPTPDLDDVAQEVFLRLMRYERTELIEHPQAYLYKMAANVAAEWSLRARHTAAREVAWTMESVADDSRQYEVEQLEIEDELTHALLTLAPRQREILKLQFFEGLSHAQIAQRIGATERTVKRVLMKSYQRLRRELGCSLG